MALRVEDSAAPSLIAIVGPTASGKTALGIKLAQRMNGEIICADSRTVYKYLDIGTAKPDKEERKAAVHHGLDLAGPGETFSVADFLHYARLTISEIKDRGKLPIVVGGSGLYIDALLYEYSMPKRRETDRKTAAVESTEGSVAHCSRKYNDIDMADLKNPRHRSLSALDGRLQRNSRPLEGSLIVGIKLSAEQQQANITSRFDKMMQRGLLEETREALKLYGSEHEVMKGNVYNLIEKVLAGSLEPSEARQALLVSDRQLVKKQLTWFRRNPDILWGTAEDIERYFLKRA